MKKTFKLKLDTEFTIDFSHWALSDAQQKDEYETMKLVINHYLKQSGVDEFEVSEKNNGSLFEAMAGVVKAQKYCALTFEDDFNYN